MFTIASQNVTVAVENNKTKRVLNYFYLNYYNNVGHDISLDLKQYIFIKEYL